MCHGTGSDPGSVPTDGRGADAGFACQLVTFGWLVDQLLDRTVRRLVAKEKGRSMSDRLTAFSLFKCPSLPAS
jgi:hypothetical protein